MSKTKTSAVKTSQSKDKPNKSEALSENAREIPSAIQGEIKAQVKEIAPMTDLESELEKLSMDLLSEIEMPNQAESVYSETFKGNSSSRVPGSSSLAKREEALLLIERASLLLSSGSGEDKSLSWVLEDLLEQRRATIGTSSLLETKSGSAARELVKEPSILAELDNLLELETEQENTALKVKPKFK